jgi:hypothetical protein
VTVVLAGSVIVASLVGALAFRAAPLGEAKAGQEAEDAQDPASEAADAADTPEAAGEAAVTQVAGFPWGRAQAEERAGFSGRPLFLVFARGGPPVAAEANAADEGNLPEDAAAPEASPEALPAVPEAKDLRALLESAEVVALRHRFVGALIDVATEPKVEVELRSAGVGGILRSLSGEVLGLLPVGFGANELTQVLARLENLREAEKSPIYAGLLESTSAIDGLLAESKLDEALKFVGLLEEFEGAESEAVRAAKTRLGN